jgi:hypothetical protein
MRPKRLLALLALLPPVIFARAADATEPVTDIGVIAQAQPTPSQPPPSQPPPLQPPPSQPPPSQPPPQYAPQYQPQPQYQPHAQYQPQYQLQYPSQRPLNRRYVEGDPVPAGYHVEEKSHQGLVTAGLVVLLIPYGISALSAVAAKGSNESSWLYVPVAGPWLTMGWREYGSCQRPSMDDSLRCVADIFVVMGLILDGIIQVTGGTLLLVGYLNTKQELVRDEAALRIRPVQVGSGYGLGLGSAF